MKFETKTVCLCALIIGLAAPSYSAPAQTAKTPVKTVAPVKVAEVQKIPQKIGVVDVKEVVSTSKEVAKVKKEQQANKKILVSFIKSSAEKINKEPDEKKKEELKKQFTNELNVKKEAMDKAYAAKLMRINDDMNAQLVKMAKDKKYDLILTQDAVLYGGDNLTKDLIKLVK